MAGCEGIRCDRCDARALLLTGGKYPEGWGVLRLARGKAFTDTGTLDLCPTCFVIVYQVARITDRHRAFVALRNELSEANICLACGAHTPGRSCQCENDE